MKILVVGKGGREHALIRAFVESPSRPEVYSFPGSDAIFEWAKPTTATGLYDLIDWMKSNAIDLCVAGEESYLVKDEGLANLCALNGIPCWGPPKESAQLEASKAFAKEFLVRNSIPTARATRTTSYDDAIQAIQNEYPTVLKFDGLAAGKGVAVCPDATSAEDFLREVFIEKRFGEGEVLVEQCLTGPEVSIFAAIVDDDYLVFAPARDYKRIFENDLGPNTGGMGAVSSRQLISNELLATIETTIVQPTVAGLRKEGLPYRGFLYFGLMLTPTGPQVIEYNCRFGDPECQAVMPLIEGDLCEFCFQGAKGQLNPSLIQFKNDWSVCVILASAGYPESSRNDDVIQGLDFLSDVRVYHAGTKKVNDTWITQGGRVLAIVAGATTRQEAVEKAHRATDLVQFAGAQRRRDIGIMHFE